MALLEIEDLTIDFATLAGPARAVHDVDLSVDEGQIVGLVGESGCGKTQTCLSITRLIHPTGTIRARRIGFGGRDLSRLSEREMRRIRGNEISMVFQEPMTSLNPCITIGEQLAEPLVLHRRHTWRQAVDRAAEQLRRVGIPDSEQRCREYPHQLSGGMRQRVMIAMALICEPRLLIADEPTTALDVTVQAQILDLVRRLRDETRAAVLLVTHNLGVVAQTCDAVSVMYAGRIAESGTCAQVFRRPGHPYTRGLMRCVPRVRHMSASAERLASIPGAVPTIHDTIPGCPFHPRCVHAQAVCARELPPRVEIEPGHVARCHFAMELVGREDEA